MLFSVLLLLCLSVPSVVGSLILSVCGAFPSQQTFLFNSSSNHIQLVGLEEQCAQMKPGCCGGEEMRSGDVINMMPCGQDYLSQMLGWPNANDAVAPNAIRITTPDVEPSMSPFVGGAPVLDAGGIAFPGALLQASSYDAISSSFTVNGTADGATLVHTASGLCLTNDPNTQYLSKIGQQINLQQCSPEKQIVGAYASTQLFSSGGGGGSGAAASLSTSQGLCLTPERVLGASYNALPGMQRLISASCSGSPLAPFPSQAFTVSSLTGAPTKIAATFTNGGGYIADAGNGSWWGTPIFLVPQGSAVAPAFTFQSVSGGYGVFTHTATGLCLDAAGVPDSQGCLSPLARSLPYCDVSLSFSARAADLASRLTLAEAISLSGSSPHSPGPCTSLSPAISRLDIPEFRSLNEVSSMASSQCDKLQGPYNGSCATSFPAGMIIAGAWNRTLSRAHGIVVGDEMRSFANTNAVRQQGTDFPISLGGHGPDINAPRDPRNGRNGELQSEDPYLTGMTALGYVAGMQYGTSTTFSLSTTRRMLASLKHYTAYSLETNRFGSIGNISMFDMWDTYLPQFAIPFIEALATGSMCSYMSIRIPDTAPAGAPIYVPSCANPYILTTVLRDYWNRNDATHLSDCGAVWNMATANHYTGTNVTLAAAVSANAGMDMNSNTIMPTQLALAVELGLVEAQTLYTAAARLLAVRISAGLFDPLESLPPGLSPSQLNWTTVGTPDRKAVAAEAASQGTVLLKNDGPVLPLKAGLRLAIVGPTASSETAHIGDMYADTEGLCPSGQLDCMVLLDAALTSFNTAGTTTYFPGVSILSNDSSWGQAIASVAQADVVILSLGTDRSVAGEGSDRTDIGLPGVQSQFALAILAAAHAASVPVVMVLLHNLPVSFDELVAAPNATYTPIAAIVDAWAPTMSAPSVAAAIFGLSNRWGKSVLTVYPHDYQNQISLYSFDMSAPPGRSYKYYTGTPLVSFGQGMSYSTFSPSCAGGFESGSDFSSITINCSIANTAGPDGDEVLMVFHRPGSDVIARVNGAHPLPLKALVDYERISVPAASNASLSFTLETDRVLAFVDANGASALYPGTHYLDVSNGNGFNATISLSFPADMQKRLVKVPPMPY